MPADREPGIQRIIDGGSTIAVDAGTGAPSTDEVGLFTRGRVFLGAISTGALDGGTAAPTTASLGVYTRPINNRPAAVTVRSSTDYNTSVTTTNTADVASYGGAIGMVVYVDQTVVDASSAGGGTGSMTHTIQFKDPIGATYINTTGVITATTAVATFIAQCYPGMGTVAPTSAAVGKYDLTAPNVWRIASASASSATNRTYSIAAQYLPTSASSS